MKRADRHLVIGMGQIGNAIYESLKYAKYTVFAKDIEDSQHKNIDILHICIPYTESFAYTISNYREQYNPDLVIVYSTVPIGTCDSIDKSIVHSPVEGKHPDLQESIRLGVRWLGSEDLIALEKAQRIWLGHVKHTKPVTSSVVTEFLKLRSTSKYGINLAWADYESKVAAALDIDFNMVKEFDSDYNELYKDLRMPQFQRYVLDSPKGKIGGHCVVPNAKLLYKQFPNDMLKEIISMEDK